MLRIRPATETAASVAAFLVVKLFDWSDPGTLSLDVSIRNAT